MSAIWSTVGSVGIASSADASKLVIFDSIVQLGPGTGIAGSIPAARIAGTPRIAGNLVTAVVRYGVDALDKISEVAGLKLRFRDGNGFVTARLIAVDRSTGAESPMVGFDSRVGYGNPSDSFRVLKSTTPDGKPIVIPSGAAAFYIELTLSAFEQIQVLPFPPAVSVIELV